MVSKFLEKQVEIKYDELYQGLRNSFELEYYLLENDNNDIVESETKKVYGIEIVKKHQGVLNESKQFQNIFNTRGKTKNLVDLLAENTVTPSSLPYILDDLLGT